MQWVLPLGVVSAMTSVCLVILLAVTVYWRWVKDMKKEETASILCMRFLRDTETVSAKDFRVH